ncbi:MAG: GHKL domain-containing protein [Firmicutes bacterium]|nr:GHKL domain-containing protein [Bacillota bacterium]
MYNFMCVILELTAMMLVGCQIYGHVPKRQRFIIWGGAVLVYAFVEAAGWFMIPVIVHYMLLIIMVFLLFWDEPIWVAPFTSLIGYGVLIYIQAIFLYWFPTEWVAQNYMLAGLVMNILTVVTVVILYIILRVRKKDVSYRNMGVWGRIVVAIVSAGVVVFCMVFKPILEIEYQINTYAYIVLFSVVGFMVYAICQESIKRRHKKELLQLKNMNAAYEARLAIDARQIHDYRKNLRAIQASQSNELLEELKKDQEIFEVFRLLEPGIQTVLLSQWERMQQEKIELRMSSTEVVPQYGFMEVDAICILGNLLENAIEAVEGLPEDQRWIKLEFGASQHTKWLDIVNPWEKEKVMATPLNGKIASSKGDGRGIGLQKVGSVLKRYSGRMVIKPAGNFEVRIDFE